MTDDIPEDVQHALEDADYAQESCVRDCGGKADANAYFIGVMISAALSRFTGAVLEELERSNS